MSHCVENYIPDDAAGGSLPQNGILPESSFLPLGRRAMLYQELSVVLANPFPVLRHFQVFLAADIVMPFSGLLHLCFFGAALSHLIPS